MVVALHVLGSAVTDEVFYAVCEAALLVLLVVLLVGPLVSLVLWAL